MKRLYDAVILDHYKNNNEMLFLVGPRQVGKTTSSVVTSENRDLFYYYNWDDEDDKARILAGATSLAEEMGLTTRASKERPTIIFDEIHKYKNWRQFLKGFYDKFGRFAFIIVTGSARLDFYRKGGDSLMGRYFPFRMHPISVAEILHPTLIQQEIRKQKKISQKEMENLLHFGGFPKPFLKGSQQFYNRWKLLRRQLLFREDLRDLTQVQDVGQMEILSEFIRQQATKLVNYSSLAKMVRVSADTIRRWTKIFRSLYFHYELRPWSKNITRSLIKEPKFFLWDWALIDEPGSRFENFIASHLLKAVHYWTDSGFGEYDLYFVRDKDKREVDFLVTKDNKPWFLVEAKISQNDSISPHLYRFQELTKAEHAFQVVYDMDYIDVNCFEYNKPVIVPASTFLSQLV